MSNTAETPKKKAAKPDFYIFTGTGDDSKIVGRVYCHGKGTGFNILLNGARYSAFRPKPKETGA